MAPVAKEKLLDDLREAAAELGEAFSSTEFSAWAKKKKRRSSQTHIKRFGSWNEARRQAGLSTVNEYRRFRRDRVSEEDCWAAVRKVAASLGHAPTAVEYDLASRDTSLPSLATVRNRLGNGKWLVVKKQAMPDVLLGQPAFDQDVGLPVAHPETAE
jgi:hypothetical protein